MTEQKRPRKPLGEYEVGYGKPPAATRFQKGMSGNPKGRPKATLSFSTLLDQILDGVVTVRDARGVRKISIRKAILMKQVDLALKGENRAFSTLYKLTQSDAHREAHDAVQVNGNASAEDEALLNDFFSRRTSKPDASEDLS